LNLVNFANFYFNRIGTVYNPLEKEKDHIFNYRVAFETTITEEKYLELQTSITRRINGAFKMCNLSDYHIDFVENSFMSKSS
jgi:regulator of sigma D